jgi:enoyl-CoA hydratase/carnithine racemase
MSEHVIVTDEAGIRTIRMYRPEKKNALTLAMYEAMTAALESANTDDAVRCVLIAGIEGAFTAGNDLGDFLAAATGDGGFNRAALRFLPALVNCRKPMVACVSGVAVGIGTTMLLHCDFVVLAENAQLSTPFINLALVPEAASTLLMPQRIGYARAYEMFALGEPMDAVTARDVGIANRVVPLERLHAEAGVIAARLAKLPAGSLSATKRLMRNPAVLSAQIGAESQIFAERLKTAEAREAFTAFAERRAADFTKVA